MLRTYGKKAEKGKLMIKGLSSRPLIWERVWHWGHIGIAGSVARRPAGWRGVDERVQLPSPTHWSIEANLAGLLTDWRALVRGGHAMIGLADSR